MKSPAQSSSSSSLNKHQRKTEITKRKLLKSALRVFTRDGFEGASIDEIAAEAGYTRGAFYAHFPSKEDLFFAMLESESRKHFEAVSAAIASLGSQQERLQALREYYVSKVADRRWSILILEFKLYAIRHPKLRAKLAEMYRSIRSKMKWGDIESIWDPGSPRNPDCQKRVRMALQAMLSGLVLERAYDPASISGDQVSLLLRQVFDFLVQAPEPPKRRR